MDYEPPLSAVPFFTSDSFISLILGPVGSGKTTASLMKVAYEAKRVAKCHDGVRRSRAVIIRNTAGMLKDSTWPDWLKLFPEGLAGDYHRTDNKFVLKFDDVVCEVLMRGLDDAADSRRLLSTQLSFGVMDEFREISPDVFNALTGRLGRYPDKTMNGVGCVDDNGKPIHKLWGATNPPGEDEFWGKFVQEPPANASVTFQPSGMAPEADWLGYLPDDYYSNLCEGKTEEWIDIYVHGKLGKSLSGLAVFRAFNKPTHVAAEEIKPVGSSGGPLIIGVDAGLSPAATIGQVMYDGRVVVYDALISESMGALRFIREKLKPLLANKFPGYKSVVVIDPAAMQRAQTDERTVRDMYVAEGFTVKFARTNSIAARLAAVDKFLTRTVDGKAGVLLCPAGAQPLILALNGKYRYKINTKGETDESPEKSHPWSDIADAFQYLCLHADGGETFGTNVSTQRREVRQVSAMGWT